jgi:hypothetical protein
MGDCRIRIVVAKTLLLPDEISRTVVADQDGDDGDHNVFSSNDTSVSFVYMYAADTTIREVTEGNFILRNIFFGSSKEIIANDDDDDGRSSRKLFTLWDCTYHPPKDITSWPKFDFPDLQGMKSKTLHTAGMFPSGTWIVVPKGIMPNKLLSDNNAYDDTQYNNSNTKNNAHVDSVGGEKAMKVEFQDPNLRSNNSNKNSNPPLPSQVMESVTNRFQQEDDEEFSKKLDGTDIIDLRRKNLQHRKRRERERVTKLDRKIQILEEQSSSSESCSSSSKKKKTKKVSDQVLRMLVKSRATGEKSLKQQDRIYYQCLVFLDDDNDNDNNDDNDNNNNTDTTSMAINNNNNNSTGDAGTAASATKESILSKEYRYFSPQDTFAKIANSFPNHHGYLSEVLCQRRRPAAGEGLVADETSLLLTHRCFPISMRIYEAISEGYLSNNDKKIDTLIIRWYRCRDNASPSIIEGKVEEDEEIVDTDNSNSNNNVITTSTISDEQIMTDATTITTPETMTPMQVDEEIKNIANKDDTPFFEDTHISNIIQKLDDLNNKGKKATTTKKPLSAVAMKLRQMKSKGNKKIKIEDRIFLNVVTIIFSEEVDNATAISEDVFMSKSEPIERILRYISTTAASTRNAEDWIFLVPQQKDSSSKHYYREISTTSIFIQEAEEFPDGKFSPFDRLILRRKNS